MNVTLPNGQVIEGVPDGTSKDEIMRKAISSGIATAEDFGGGQEKGFVDSVTSGLLDVYRGATGTKETVKAIGSGLAGSAVSGLTGAGTAVLAGQEAGAGVQQQVQQDLTYVPQTEEGKKGVAAVGEFAKLFNVPMAGLSGLFEVLTGGTLDDAVAKIDRVKDGGIGKEVGGAVLESTDSPALATLAEMGSQGVSDVAMGGAGLGVGQKALRIASDVGPSIAPKVVQAGKDLAIKSQDLAKQGYDVATNIKTPATKEIARQLQTGEINTDIARFKLGKEGIENPSDVQKILGLDLPKVVKDKPLIKASNQGFNEGFLETVRKKITPENKTALIKMTNWAENGRRDPTFKQMPSFVAGDALLDKVKTITSINKLAGKKIGASGKLLKGQKFDVSDIGDDLLDAFSELKIKVVGGNENIGYANAKIDFTDALVSGAGRKRAIKDIFGRMIRNESPDALDMHELKRFIDEVVSYGKNIRGLGGNAERVLKDLRFNIKTKLEANFPEYAKANKAYSDTINALDEIQDLAGKKTDLTADSAGGDLARLMRSLTSNNVKRGRVRTSMEKIDQILADHSGFGKPPLIGKGKEYPDLDLLMNYADQIDKVTGSKATTGFTGSAETAAGLGARMATGGWKSVLADKAVETAKGAAGITEKNAYKSMLDFINAQKKRSTNE